MKAMRERLNQTLTISTGAPQKNAASTSRNSSQTRSPTNGEMRRAPSNGGSGQKHARIRPMTEADFAKQYKLAGQVMESTNTGMDVLFATRCRDGVQVVIKRRMRANSFKSQAEEREWRITTEYQLNMPKVETLCQLYDVLETNKAYYVVMEKCEGQDLFEQMAREKLPIVDAREVVRQILEALAIMHESGRIHKDLKFENIMVDMNPKMARKPSSFDGADPASPVSAKIIDFDTVQDWEPNSPKTKDVLGTDGYIAPEAYSGDYSPASDIYATGVIMYKLLTRKFPSKPELFDDKPGENYVGSPAMKRIKERLRVQQIDFTLSPLNECAEARELVQSMLAFDAEKRPEAKDALRHKFFQLPPSALAVRPSRSMSSSRNRVSATAQGG